MHPKNNKRIEDAIKYNDDNVYLNPILKALSTTGYDLDDLSALTCIPKMRLWQLCHYDILPTDEEKSSIQMILQNYE